jgi:hypothetical protein
MRKRKGDCVGDVKENADEIGVKDNGGVVICESLSNTQIHQTNAQIVSQLIIEYKNI